MHATNGTIWSRQAQTCRRQARPREGGENQGRTHGRTGRLPLHCSHIGRTGVTATHRGGGPPRVRRCAQQHARTRRTHRELLHARPRRACHQATATDTGLRPPPANASTVCPSMRRPRLTCPDARLSPRLTSRPAVALLPARHWAPPGARDSLTKPRRRGWIWLWYKLICTRDWLESTQSETPESALRSVRGFGLEAKQALLDYPLDSVGSSPELTPICTFPRESGYAYIAHLWRAYQPRMHVIRADDNDVRAPPSSTSDR